jgi:hypothetical protein
MCRMVKDRFLAAIFDDFTCIDYSNIVAYFRDHAQIV